MSEALANKVMQLDQRVTRMEAEFSGMHKDIKMLTSKADQNYQLAQNVLVETKEIRSFAKGASYLFGVLIILVPIIVALL